MRVFVMSVVVLVAFACGGKSDHGDKVDGESGKKVETSEKKAGASPTGKTVEPAKEAATLKVSGKAVVAVKSDAGPAGEGEVEIKLGDGDEATGMLTIRGEQYAMRGVKQGDHLRLWIASDESDANKVRRGYLVGVSAGKQFKGTFALSGNGGEPSLNGTWSGQMD
ncbi:MAG: hypothetical protein GY854_29070 [Deltaproteobacteria bacterium]|nr:hypothetical protein [Deltaproteobacteria bacterium]